MHQKYYLVLYQITIRAIIKQFSTCFYNDEYKNTEFSSVEVWFTDQCSKAIEIEHNVNLTLIIG